MLTGADLGSRESEDLEQPLSSRNSPPRGQGLGGFERAFDVCCGLGNVRSRQGLNVCGVRLPAVKAKRVNNNKVRLSRMAESCGDLRGGVRRRRPSYTYTLHHSNGLQPSGKIRVSIEQKAKDSR